jgi:hypothetical protein
MRGQGRERKEEEEDRCGNPNPLHVYGLCLICGFQEEFVRGYSVLEAASVAQKSVPFEVTTCRN